MAEIINPRPLVRMKGPPIPYLKALDKAAPNAEEGWRWRYIMATAPQRRAVRPVIGNDPINQQHVWNEWKRPDPARAHVRQIGNMVKKHEAKVQKHEVMEAKKKYLGSVNLGLFLLGGMLFYMLFV